MEQAELKRILAREVSHKRRNLQWTVDDLARSSGCDALTIFYMEDADRNELPRLTTLLKVANTLGCAISELLDLN